MIAATYQGITFKRYVGKWMGSNLSRYCRVLDTYLEAFGEDRVHGFFYHFSGNGSSNVEILNAMGAGQAAEVAVSTIDNQSRSAEVTELKRRLNPTIDAMIRDFGGRDVPRFHTVLSDLLAELAVSAGFDRIDEQKLLGPLPRRAVRHCERDWKELCSRRYAHVFSGSATVAAK